MWTRPNHRSLLLPLLLSEHILVPIKEVSPIIRVAKGCTVGNKGNSGHFMSPSTHPLSPIKESRCHHLVANQKVEQELLDGSGPSSRELSDVHTFRQKN